MAGISRNDLIQMKKVTKKRRLWTQNGEDRTTWNFHLLKESVAEEGCQFAQLDVGKKYIQDSEGEDVSQQEKKIYARKAVFWLIKSSEQGNEEATSLLKECLNSGKGITLQNELDIWDCITTPFVNKLTCKAAKNLFETLSNGEEYITTSQLFDLINKNKEQPSIIPNESCETNPNNEPIADLNESSSFEDITGIKEGKDKKPDEKVNWDSHSAQNGIKLTQEDLMTVARHFNKGEVSNVSINWSTRIHARDQWKFFSYVNVNLFTIFLLFIFLSKGSVEMKELGILITGFLVTWSSFNILVWRKRHLTFQDWSSAFKISLKNQTWSEKSGETKLIANVLLPALIVNGLSLGILLLVPGHYSLKIIFSIIAIYSLIRGIIFNRIRGWVTLAFVFFLLELIPKMGFSASNGSLRIFELADSVFPFHQIYTDYFTDQISYFVPEFILNSRIKGTHLVKLFLILSIVVYKKRKNNFSFVQNFLPKILCVNWIWQCVQFSMHLHEDKIVVIGGISALIFFTYFFFDRGVSLSFATLFTVIFFLFLFLSLYGQLGVKETDKLLKWEEYDQHCHLSSWKSKTIAETQISCHKLFIKQIPNVKWTGRIIEVNVVKIEGLDEVELDFQLKLSILPSKESGTEEDSWMSFLSGSENEKSLVLLYLYTEILHSNDKEKMINFVLKLRPGDKVQFSGKLNKNFGGFLPEIGHVEMIRCIDCQIGKNEILSLISPSKFKLSFDSAYQFLTSIIN